jgi:hypothetical protein
MSKKSFVKAAKREVTKAARLIEKAKKHLYEYRIALDLAQSALNGAVVDLSDAMAEDRTNFSRMAQLDESFGIVSRMVWEIQSQDNGCHDALAVNERQISDLSWVNICLDVVQPLDKAKAK